MTLAVVQDFAAYDGFRVLEESDLPHVLNLQEACINDLGEGQTLIHEKSEDDFGTILTSTNSEMLGIWNQGVLIAQAVALFPDIQNPDADMLDMLDRELWGVDPGKVTTLGGVIVHPSFKGQGLMHNLVGHWKDSAVERGRQHTLAMITDNNVPSLAGFLHGGLDIIGIRTDPADDSTVYLAHGDPETCCRQAFSHANVPGEKMIVSTMELESREIFFELGYKGVGLIKSHCLGKTPEGYCDGPAVLEDQSALCMVK